MWVKVPRTFCFPFQVAIKANETRVDEKSTVMDVALMNTTVKSSADNQHGLLSNELPFQLQHILFNGPLAWRLRLKPPTSF